MTNRIRSFFAITVVLFALASCSTPKNNPKIVAKRFFEALTTMNIDEATKYATTESKSILDLMRMGMSMSPKNIDSLRTELSKQKVEYSDPVINGDEAMVTVTVNDKDKMDLKLKKQEGDWKVAFDKTTLMKTDMPNMEQKTPADEEMRKAQEELERMSTDSVE